MIKNVVRLYDLKPTRSNTHAAGTWLRLTRSVSAALRTVLSWPALVYRERRDMELLSRMNERELADIGLIRQDLYDMQALPFGRSPTSALGQLVHQRKDARFQRVTSRPDVATWGF